VALCLLTSNGAAGALIASITVAIILLSSVVVTGYAGQLSLAQLGIAGIGAFVAARVGQALGLDFWEAALVGLIGVIPIGALLGLPALRARGVNLAIVTLGFGIVVEDVIFSNPAYTGGQAGTVVQTPTLWGYDLNAELHPQRYAVMSVSYTHLDVYKRQVLREPVGAGAHVFVRIRGDGAIGRSDRETGHHSIWRHDGRRPDRRRPRRRGLRCGQPGRAARPAALAPDRRVGVGSQPPVSYTHLDVYKRQSSMSSVIGPPTGHPGQ